MLGESRKLRPILVQGSRWNLGAQREGRFDRRGQRWLFVEGDAPLLFTENETNRARLFGEPNATPYVKDGINDFVVAGRRDAVNPEHRGTKAAVHHVVTVAPGKSQITVQSTRCLDGSSLCTPSLLFRVTITSSATGG